MSFRGVSTESTIIPIRPSSRPALLGADRGVVKAPPVALEKVALSCGGALLQLPGGAVRGERLGQRCRGRLVTMIGPQQVALRARVVRPDKGVVGFIALGQTEHLPRLLFQHVRGKVVFDVDAASRSPVRA